MAAYFTFCFAGPSTNYGLKEAKIEDWKKLNKIRDYGD